MLVPKIGLYYIPFLLDVEQILQFSHLEHLIIIIIVCPLTDREKNSFLQEMLYLCSLLNDERKNLYVADYSSYEEKKELVSCDGWMCSQKVLFCIRCPLAQ